MKPKKTHDRASKRSMTGAEAAEQAANRTEKAAARSVTPQQDKSDGDDGIIVPRTPLPMGESQGGTTITLALRTPERLHGSLNLIPSLASEPEDSPEPQVQLPASTAPARIEEGEEGARKRRRRANRLYSGSQYEL